ncbi:hypothetical protein CRG98_033087 [Punica granatum]|uniref:Uncharacterized protein n=1 Tax=Punica granatum TaxID=22663 RepID=A0A2I0IS83_PUNGR|nr:hypothetical protein CRG98_033087 [Punica granatum]
MRPMTICPKKRILFKAVATVTSCGQCHFLILTKMRPSDFIAWLYRGCLVSLFLNSGEAQIDHGEALAVSRTVTGVHSSPHRGVQGREPPPAASSPPFPATPIARRLTSLGPVHFLRRSSPNHSAQRAQSGPALFRTVPPSGGQSDPIRSDPTHLAIFFIYRITPQLFELGKFST